VEILDMEDMETKNDLSMHKCMIIIIVTHFIQSYIKVTDYGSNIAIKNQSIVGVLRDCIIAPNLKLKRSQAQSLQTKQNLMLTEMRFMII
jgi:hypothetical protein